MRNSLLIFLLLSFPVIALSQVDSGSLRHDMQRYKQQYSQQLQAYKDTINSQFILYLQQRWDAMQLFQGEAQPLRPEPVKQPESDSLSDTLHSEQLPIGDAVTLLLEHYQPLLTDKESTYIAEIFNVSFYGEQLTFKVPTNISKIRLAGVRERQVADYWQLLNKEKLSQLSLQLVRSQQELRLNGWGLYDLVSHLANRVYPSDANQQTAFTVYLLNQMHYDVRMGRLGSSLVSLMTASTNLYDIPYTLIGSNRYYVFLAKEAKEERSKSLYTYSKQLDGADHCIDFFLIQSPQLGGRLSPKPYRNTFRGNDISIYVNQNLMDFYSHFPQMGLQVYANAAIDEVFYLSLERNIKPLLTGMGPFQSVATLLKYVQDGFGYMSDNVQFGREKNFFCEENFYYPANDCEDRALLFSYLVRMFVGVDVVLLEYPDHVAAAVCFPTDAKVSGCYYLYKGKSYVVCDPTCKGAKVGQINNRFKKQSPKIIQTI